MSFHATDLAVYAECSLLLLYNTTQTKHSVMVTGNKWILHYFAKALINNIWTRRLFYVRLLSLAILHNLPYLCSYTTAEYVNTQNTLSSSDGNGVSKILSTSEPP